MFILVRGTQPASTLSAPWDKERLQQVLGKEGKNLYAGTGLPEICIPMTADSREALAASARNIRDASCADAAEWRADWFSGNLSEQTVRAETAELKNILADKPLIFTIRSTGEGGKADYSADQFVHLAAAAAEAGADLVDCELSQGEEAVRKTRVCVRRAGAHPLQTFLFGDARG